MVNTSSVTDIKSLTIDRKFQRSQLKQLISLIGGIPIMGATPIYIKPKDENAHYRPFPACYKKHRKERFRENNDFFLASGDSATLDEFMEYLSSDSFSLGNSLLLRSPIHVKGEVAPQVLIIIDLDRHSDDPEKDGVSKYKNEVQPHYNTPKTLCVSSRSGFHLYFYISMDDAQEIGIDSLQLTEGIDVLLAKSPKSRSHTPPPGTQFIRREADGSKTKITYKIVTRIPIQKLPQNILDDIKAKGSYIKGVDEEITKNVKAFKILQSKNIKLDSNENTDKANAYLGLLIGKGTKYGEGFRDTQLNNFVYKIASFGLSEDKVLDVANAFDSHCIDPPLGHEVVTDKVKRAYDDRLKKDEVFENAKHEIRSFTPYPTDHNGNLLIDIDDFTKRVSASSNNNINALKSSPTGISLLAATTVVCNGKYYTTNLIDINSLYASAYSVLQSARKHNKKLTLGDCKNVISSGSINYNEPLSGSSYRTQIGRVPHCIVEKADKGSMMEITQHEVFEQQVLRVSHVYIDYRSNKVVSNNRFNMVSSHPLLHSTRLTPSEMENAKPMIDKIWELFANAITDVKEPSEIEYIKDWLSNVIRNDNHSNMVIVIKGAQGSGKSAFADFASLFLPDSHYASYPSAESAFGRFNKFGRLAILHEAKTLLSILPGKENYVERLKEASTQNERQEEIKGGAKFKVRGYVNFLLLTNKEIVQKEILDNRRLFLLDSLARYDADEFSDRFNDMCQWLLDENMAGLKAMYQSLMERKPRQEKWEIKTKYHSLQRELSMNLTLEEQDRLAVSGASSEENTEERDRNIGIVLNAIDAAGFISASISEDFRYNLTLSCDKVQEEIKQNRNISATTYDFLYLVTYYMNLKNGILYKPRVMEGKKNIKLSLTRLTKSIKNNRTGLGLIMDHVEILPKSQITPRIQMLLNSKHKTQKALLVSTPISDWISRLCFLTGDTNNKDNADYLIERAGLKLMVDFLLDCEARSYTPTRAECEKVHKRMRKDLYPKAVFTEFDVLSNTKCLEAEEIGLGLEEIEGDNNNNEEDWGTE